MNEAAFARKKAFSASPFRGARYCGVAVVLPLVVGFLLWNTRHIVSFFDPSIANMLVLSKSGKDVSCNTTYQIMEGPSWNETPTNWTFSPPPPNHCQNPNVSLPRIMHYHIQHHAGTMFWSLAYNNGECAPRACEQKDKHCLVSYSSKVEANHIRNNTPLTYISYEIMLPPRFPFPFVQDRDGLFFTTIMRNPMDRLKTVFRRIKDPQESFWRNSQGRSSHIDAYNLDNMSVRWLAGVGYNRPITEQDMNLAKCRLELFDLVMTDVTLEKAMTQVICPRRNWEKCQQRFRNQREKENPFETMESHYVGAWIERQRPSFELYDYARLLSVQQLEERYGLNDTGDNLLKPSFVQTMELYTNTSCAPHCPMLKRRSLEPEGTFPPAFCQAYNQTWASNVDAVPRLFGIGCINKNQKR